MSGLSYGRPRLASFGLVVVLTLIAVLAVASTASAKATTTINLCVTKSGPEKGAVRFSAGAKCKPGEQLIQVMPKTPQDVLGASESSAEKGEASAR